MRQGTIVTVAPVGEPLTLADARLQLRLDEEDTDQDVHVAKLIAAARAHIEGSYGIPIIRQTRETHLFSFGGGPVWLGDAHNIEVTLVQYYDAAGVLQTLAPTAYIVDHISRPAKLWPAPMTAWPSALCRPSGVQITWQGGWADAEAVPEDLAHAMKLLIGHWDQNREAVALGTISTEIQVALDACLQPYRCLFIA